MRVRRGVLQTPAIRFAHRDGRTVTVIGTSHAGEPAYYEAVHDLACRLEAAGAVVQFETLRDTPEEEWARASEEERAARDRLEDWFGDNSATLKLVRRHLGWATQHDLAYEPSWQNADLNSLEFIRAVTPAVILAQAREPRDDSGDEDTLNAMGPFVVLVFRGLAVDRFRLLTRFVSRRAGREAADRAIVDARNERALSLLPGDRDAVMIWGCDHLGGLRSGLRAAGFRKAGTAWLDAGRLPGLLRSLRDLWPALPKKAERDSTAA